MELKFRAWHKEHERYYEVVTIYFELKTIEVIDDTFNDVRFWDFDDVIIEQYTGVEDVFVGDIVEHKVEQRDGKVTTEQSVIINMYTVRLLWEPKVIGNIHENKELLK